MKKSWTKFVRLFLRQETMRRKRKKIRNMKKPLLQITVMFLAAFDLLLCQNALAYSSASPAIQGRPAAPVRIETIADAPTLAVQGDIGLPVRIKIPSIRVNAVIRSVGLASDGSMGVPKLPRDTAWYKLGPKPGETGSAVIAGHVNWYNGATGSFERLKNLRPGDAITVQDDKGARVSFVVREIRKVDAAANATDIFTSQDGKAHLNLVTCAGVWNKRTKQYTQRLVVFADKAMEQVK